MFSSILHADWDKGESHMRPNLAYAWGSLSRFILLLCGLSEPHTEGAAIWVVFLFDFCVFYCSLMELSTVNTCDLHVLAPAWAYFCTYTVNLINRLKKKKNVFQWCPPWCYTVHCRMWRGQAPTFLPRSGSVKCTGFWGVRNMYWSAFHPSQTKQAFNPYCTGGDISVTIFHF